MGNAPFQQGGINHLDDKVATKNIIVERYGSIDEYQPRHILFVSQAVKLQPVLAKTRDQHVLVIAGLAKMGAAINLVGDSQGNRLQIEINLVAAKAAGLRLDARLSRLSGVVIFP